MVRFAVRWLDLALGVVRVRVEEKRRVFSAGEVVGWTCSPTDEETQNSSQRLVGGVPSSMRLARFLLGIEIEHWGVALDTRHRPQLWGRYRDR